MTSPQESNQPRSGAEQPIDPEDLARAKGQDPTPAATERARQEMEEKGSQQAVEDVLPDEAGNPPGPTPTEKDRRAGLSGA
jgi:hypothetical protein